MNNLDKNMNKIVNLYSFSFLFSNLILGNNIFRHSPDYIKEKYDHFIGFEPVSNQKLSDSDKITLEKYNWSNKEIVSKQILYLNNKTLNLNNMVYFFEKYIGPISMICDERKYGLHKQLEHKLEEIIEINSNQVKIVLRDLRIRSIL